MFLRLADGDPSAARADLARSSWPTPSGDFHMQHWFELQARAELAMYEGTATSVAESLLPEFERLRRSSLFFARPLRCSANWAWARFWLSLASDPAHRRRALRRADELARRLRRDRSLLAEVWAGLVEASVAECRGDRVVATATLERAERRADERSLRLYAAAARWRRAGMLKSPESQALRARVEAWQRREGVVDLPRLVDVTAPGFRVVGAGRAAPTEREGRS